MTKTCTKCSTEHPATVNYFHRHPGGRGGLNAICKKCRCKAQNQYRQTLRGYLREVFHDLVRRCTNPKSKDYKWYGGRGIENKFISFDDFFAYVVFELGIENIKQLKGLQIDRIDNDGNYEKGNIHFITRSENIHNRRPCSVVRKRDKFGRFKDMKNE